MQLTNVLDGIQQAFKFCLTQANLSYTKYPFTRFEYTSKLVL